MESRKLFWQTKLSAEIKILYIELESLQQQQFNFHPDYISTFYIKMFSLFTEPPTLG